MKKAHVIWSDIAWVDLDTIYDFLDEKSHPAAKLIVENILARTTQLETLTTYFYRNYLQHKAGLFQNDRRKTIVVSSKFI